MIAYIRGRLADAGEDYVILETQGIGYRIFVSSLCGRSLPGIGEEVMLHTYLNVREDAMQLYGFPSRDDLTVFKLLLGVGGIGPKGALGILSVMTADELRFAVFAGDTKAIAKAPGVGSKTAQRVVLELKDKLKLTDTLDHQDELPDVHGNHMGEVSAEAIQALVALGYGASESARAVKKVTVTEETDVESVLKQALRLL